MTAKVRENQLAVPSAAQTRINKADQQELDNINARKAETLKQLIEGIRVRLREIWEATLVDTNIQKKFHHAWNDHWTDWGLHEHDAYLAQMEIRFSSTAPIIALIKERDDILAEKEEFDRTSTDPDRYKQPGRLLYEEKFRNKLKNQLPATDAKIKKLAQLWEVEHGSLIIRGKRLIQDMDKAAEDRRQAGKSKIERAAGMAAVDHDEEERQELTATIADNQDRIALLRRQMGVTDAKDPSAPEGETLHAQNERIQNILNVVEEAHGQRSMNVQQILDDLHARWLPLGHLIETGCRDVGTDVSDARIKSLYEKITAAQAESADRVTKVNGLVGEIKKLIGIVFLKEEGKLSDLDKMCLTDDAAAQLGLLDGVIVKLTARRDEIEAIKTARQYQIRELGREIRQLWQRLATPVHDQELMWTRLKVSKQQQNDYFFVYAPLNQVTIDAITAELKFFSEAKNKNLKQYIDDARRKIRALWTETLLDADTQKRHFPQFFVGADAFTDDLLDQHEAEADRLEARAVTLRPLLALINERNAILAENTEFERTSVDPKRFQKDPNRQAYEEQFRVKIASYLPDLEKRLKLTVQEWEEKRGRLVLNGQHFLTALSAEIEARLRAVNHKLLDTANAVREQRKAASQAGSVAAVRENERIEKELGVLAEQKTLNLKILINQYREHLNHLWDEMKVDEKTRRLFAHAFNDSYTDHSLAEHEKMVNLMTKREESVHGIMELFRERAQILEELAEFVLAQKDPSRFRVPGRLTYEEMFRDKVKNYLPALEQKIKLQVQEYEARSGPLMINGARYIDEINGAIDQREREAAEFRERVTAGSRKGSMAPSRVNSRPPSRPSSKPGSRDGSPTRGKKAVTGKK